MNILRKIFTLFFLFIFVFNISNVKANSIMPLYKEIILTKKELKKNKSGEKYVKQIKYIVEKYKNDIEMLEKLKQKIDLINKNSLKNVKTKDIINYLNAEINLALTLENKRKQYQIVSKKNIKSKEKEIIKIKADKIVSSSTKSNISEEEQNLIEKELIKIQLNLFEKGISNFDVLLKKFEKYSNYQQKGDLNASFNFSQNNFGKIDSKIDVYDYVAKKSNFDSQFKGKINAYINSDLKGKNKENLNFSTFIDFISKDGNFYILLKNLNIGENNIEKFKNTIQELQKIAKENKYIKYNDSQNEKVLKILKTLTPNKILKQGKEILNKPMFKTYKKVDDKYYIIPTKYACGKAKEFLNKFDPFYGKSCSDSQYKSMIKSISKKGELYVSIGENTTLGFEGIEKNDKIDFKITFSQEYIQNLDFSIIPNQEKYPNEKFIINYEKNKKLTSKFFANGGKIDFNFNSTLNKENKFNYINFVGKINYYNLNFNSNLKLDNKNIKGNFSFNNYAYKINGDISGSNNSENNLENLAIKYSGKNSKDEEFLNGDFSFSKGSFDFKNNLETNLIKGKLIISGKYDSFEKSLSSGDFQLIISKKDFKWDEETFTIIYGKDFKEIFNSKLNIANNAINGETILKIDGIKNLTIFHNGNYEKNYFNFKNRIKIEDNLLKQIENLFNSPINGNEINLEINSIDSNLNLNFDMRNQQYNSNVYFDFLINNEKIINFEIKNKSNIEFKDVEINSPDEKNTIKFDYKPKNRN